MSILGKNAKLGLGATPNYIASIRSIEWDEGDVNLVESELLDEDPPVQYTTAKGSGTINVTVEKKTGDTNGQMALVTAYAARTSLLFTLAPEGTTAGSPKITGTIFVQSMGKETYDKKTLVTKNIVLKVSGAFTAGVFP